MPWKTTIIFLAGLISASGACAVAPAAGADPQWASVPIVYGYSYAKSCPAAGIAEKVDHWGMYECNCTSYVAWALETNGQRIDWFIPGAMDARNWPHVAELAGLRVTRQPVVGAVAVWPKLARPYGHVAYVTAVAQDGHFSVSEYNSPSPFKSGAFSFDTRSNLTPAGAIFIVVPRTSSREQDDPHSGG